MKSEKSVGETCCAACGRSIKVIDYGNSISIVDGHVICQECFDLLAYLKKERR